MLNYVIYRSFITHRFLQLLFVIAVTHFVVKHIYSTEKYIQNASTAHSVVLASGNVLRVYHFV